MQRFGSVDEFAAMIGEEPKWCRAVEAMRRIDRLRPDVTASVGDSLTYRLTRSPDRRTLSRSLRYLQLRYVVDGRVVIGLGDPSELEETIPYSDLSDRQEFAGSGSAVELAAGEVVVVGPDQALRDLLVEGRMLVLRVTVEPEPASP